MPRTLLSSEPFSHSPPSTPPPAPPRKRSKVYGSMYRADQTIVTTDSLDENAPGEFTKVSNTSMLIAGTASEIGKPHETFVHTCVWCLLTLST